MPSSLVARNPDQLILTIRGLRVVIDADLAALYGVPTKVLNQAVKRNQERFPETFAFQLTSAEKAEVVTVCDHLQRLKFSPVKPRALTEHGALMAATVLNSPTAVRMSVELIGAFVRLRTMALSVEQLARKVDALERGFRQHGEQFKAVFDALRHLMSPPPDPPKRRIGFSP